MRRILANLDCESDLAAFSGRHPGQLTKSAVTSIAGAGTLLRVFAEDGDSLWLPAPIAPERVLDVPGLPRPRLEAGALKDLPPADDLLTWGETAEISKLRSTHHRESLSTERPLHERLWHLPPPDPQVAAAVNDRFFCFETAHEIGCALPGARRVTTPDELEASLQSPDARDLPWVLKAPFSAAGRWRVIHRPGDNDPRRNAERLLARHGRLLYEPWMDRVEDFGAVALLTEQGVEAVSCHRLEVDSQGRFCGLELKVGASGFDNPWLLPDEQENLETTVDRVAQALAREGYVGPFGVDAWRYCRSTGSVAFHPLGEINARLTFGLVARALVDRLMPALRLAPEDTIRLVFGGRHTRGGISVPLLASPDGTSWDIHLERYGSNPHPDRAV